MRFDYYSQAWTYPVHQYIGTFYVTADHYYLFSLELFLWVNAISYSRKTGLFVYEIFENH
jgi:hypothetical protein